MARRALVERDLAPIEVSEKKSILQFEITREKVPRKELMHFSRQLAVFMKAGIPVLEALDVLSEEVGSKVFKRILAEMAEALRSGETFASAADAHPHGKVAGGCQGGDGRGTRGCAVLYNVRIGDPTRQVDAGVVEGERAADVDGHGTANPR